MSTEDHTTNIPVKCCTKCKKILPETAVYFYKQSECKNGLRPDCKICCAKATRMHYKNNRDECRKRANARNANNPERNRARVREWSKANPDKRREQNKRDYARNRETICARARTAYQAYPERHKKSYQRDRLLHPERRKKNASNWQKNNVDKARIKGHRHRAKMRMLAFDFTILDWQRCLDYFDNRCAVCGRPRGLWHTLSQDHWIPVMQGGGFTTTNIIPLCHGQDGCNNSKNDRDAVEWLTDKFGPRKAKQILKRIDDYFAWIRTQEHD